MTTVNISPKDVMKLRDRTGLGMGECKNALVEANGDMEAAEKIIREKMKGKMDARTDRAAGEGCVVLAKGNGKAAIVEIRSETDFTSRNEEFRAMASAVAAHALTHPTGSITADTLFNTMPFDNTITTMFLSGREVQETLDFATARSSERGCQSQIQVAGIEFQMNCNSQIAEDILINGVPLQENGVYELATNNYIAHGGSGFEVLQRNTTQVDTGISIRDVVRNEIIQNATLPQAGVCQEDGRINAVY